MNSSLDIENFLKDFSCNCKNVQKKSFRKNQTITTYIQKRNQVCILLSGAADLVRYDLNGDKSIIEHFSKNDIFGEAFYIVTTNNELSVEAKKNCEVLFFIYDNIYQKCRNNCKFHQILSANFSNLILNKVMDLNTRIEILTKRTIREKLRGYFNILSTRSLSKTFILPFSLTDLADFLSVDRSAMMRELKSLKDEGFIKKNGNRITLLYK
ncbi:MAG: Crp/Fnr family transcriptional regulator [Clostridia bacterium]|nr:Crp/Fnr family transcriptional regulator [Clostridia bacterium]